MDIMRKFIVLLLLAAACACAREASVVADVHKADDSEYPGYEVDSETGLPMNPSTRRLPTSVKVISDTDDNFGIDVSALSQEQASIVRSAWENYGKILSGGYPGCAHAPYAPADGGTVLYFCDGYDIARVHGLSGTVEAPGYEYGPSVDFLNGQHVEHLKFYTQEQMARVDQVSP